ncbi:MAG: DNA mismatch repair endonuclease MutL [Flavobacteriaceae bacterium]
MPDIIALLPDHVANQIAAGEVIQRPASVVKELLENAIDAQADTIQLLIRDAGRSLVHVIDNGTGMTATDLRLAFERHATSKIKQAEDLFSLQTKGFRGEALASVAAVAQVEVHSKIDEADLGSCLKIEGSEVLLQENSATATGTSIAVKNLFFNIPARRNFLKSDAVEMRHILDEFHRVALAHPDIKFQLYQNDNELLNLPALSLKKRILGIFGGKYEAALVPIHEQTSVALMEGFILKPEQARKSRGQQFFFVNQRFIKSSFLHHAVSAAFEGMIGAGYHPGYFIFLHLNPKTLDINIHPTKTEIKFEDEQSIYSILRSTVKHALGLFQVAPTLDFDRDPNLDPSYSQTKTGEVNRPSVSVNPQFNPFAESTPPTKAEKQAWEQMYSQLHQQNKANETQQQCLTPPDSFASQVTCFQWQQKYLITQLGGQLYILHQNRAHQRVLYEQFLKQLNQSEPVAQTMLFPVKLQLSVQEKVVFESIQENLEGMGFQFQWEGEALSILAAPQLCTSDNVGSILQDILHKTEEQPLQESFSVSDHLSKLLAVALAVKSGQRMLVQEQEQLIQDLFACTEPRLSPRNQQIFLTFESEEIEKKLL